MKKEHCILNTAQTLALTADTWADLSNALFDPEEGLVARAYPTRQERAQFLKTQEYRTIRGLVDAAQERTGLIDGATLKKSGKFVVRLPRSLHAALEIEAEEEGTSLNQLVVTKLAIQMSRLASGSAPEMAKLAQAYLEVRDGYSIDRVVADPELDRRFLGRCRELALAGTDFALNWKLFNGRKNKHFSDLPKTKNYTSSREDEFEFSSEIAIRHVQERHRLLRNHVVSLDRIICDPDLAAEFDQVAARLAPGFSPLDYRWVALGIRKAAGRYSSKAQAIKLPRFDVLGPTISVRLHSLPPEQGMYWFRCEDASLFIGETDNLRRRIERHLDCGGKNGFPDWLYDAGSRAVTLGIAPTPGVTPIKRKIVELRAIQAHRPFFNYVGGQVA